MCNEYRMVAIPEWGMPVEFDPSHPELGVTESGEPAFAIDACIADALLAVWAAGFRTLGCCCGHGQTSGGIITLDMESRPVSYPLTQTQQSFADLHAVAKS